MAERALRRKGVLYFSNISPVTLTLHELVKTKLKQGKFPQTKTGIIKMTGLVSYL